MIETNFLSCCTETVLVSVSLFAFQKSSSCDHKQEETETCPETVHRNHFFSGESPGFPQQSGKFLRSTCGKNREHHRMHKITFEDVPISLLGAKRKENVLKKIWQFKTSGNQILNCFRLPTNIQLFR